MSIEQDMIRVFELFGRPPEWLSTHPLSDSRIAEVKREIVTDTRLNCLK